MSQTALPCPICGLSVARTLDRLRTHVKPSTADRGRWAHQRATSAYKAVWRLLDDMPLLGEEQFAWLDAAVRRELDRRDRTSPPPAPRFVLDGTARLEVATGGRPAGPVSIGLEVADHDGLVHQETYRWPAVPAVYAAELAAQVLVRHALTIPTPNWRVSVRGERLGPVG